MVATKSGKSRSAGPKSKPKKPAKRKLPPPTPLGRRLAELDAQTARGAAERAAVAALLHAVETVIRPALKAFPELAPLLEEDVWTRPPQRGNHPIPDAGALRVARTQVETETLDTLDLVTGDGRLFELKETPDGRPEPTSIVLTDALYTRMLHTLFPAHYPEKLPEPEPTRHPPGSAEKVAVMVARVERGEAVTSERDADLTGARTVWRGNHKSRRVLSEVK